MDRKRSPFCTTFGGERGNAGAEIHTHYALPSAGKTAIQPRHGTYCSAQKSNDFYSWKRKDVKTSLPPPSFIHPAKAEPVPDAASLRNPELQRIVIHEQSPAF